MSFSTSYILFLNESRIETMQWFAKGCRGCQVDTGLKFKCGIHVAAEKII